MSTYKATFVATAEVVIEFEVEADNQQDGLVLAHDFLEQVQPGQARIVKLDLSKALNSAFEKVDAAAPDLPMGPLEMAGKFKVAFFASGDWSGTPAVETELPSFEAAKPVAESVLADDSAYGSARIVDELGMMVLKARSARGGWESEGYGADNQLVERYSWQDSRADAKTSALALLDRRDIAFVRIVDYTQRQQGPVLWREIR